MRVQKFTVIRNVCFSLGVLVALLCVFPPPDVNFFLGKPQEVTSRNEAAVMDELPPPDVHAAELVSETPNQHNDQNIDESTEMKRNEEPVSEIQHHEDENEVTPNEEIAVEQELKDDLVEDDNSMGFLKVAMELESGHVFYFTVDLGKSDISSMASNFCYEHGDEIGVDKVNIQRGCIDPVQHYITEQVNKHKEPSQPVTKSTIVTVDINIQGRNVQFDIDTNSPNAIQEEAIYFCTQYGAEFDVTEETLPTCISNIVGALEGPLSSYISHPDEGSVTDDLVAANENETPVVHTEARTNYPVFVSSFPLGSKNFDYEYTFGVDAAVNAANFCKNFWSELEGAYIEAGMTGVDEKTCALIVEEVTFHKVQQFADTIRAAEQ